MGTGRSLGIIAGVLILWTVPLSAGTITDLFDTGVGNNGVALPNGTSPDPHYTIITGSDGSVASSTTVYNSPYWFPGTATAAWITPSAGYTNYFMPIGYYDYLTTFTLPSGADSVAISAYVGTDDPGDAIFLNGESLGVPPYGGFYPYNYIPISFGGGDVLVGTNTLVFQVYNDGGPTGLFVGGVSGTYTTIPEPSCVGLLSIIGSLILVRRGRRR